MSKDVTTWLKGLGLGQYADAFDENAISWSVLAKLDHELLKEMGIKAIGHRIQILEAAAATDSEQPRQEPEIDQPVTSGDAERRQLTVMFCDLVGSTELSQELDPEDLREINRAYQDACKAAIERYEGYVARYMGDGVLAYFGYPQAHEDDAARAVYAGLNLVEQVGGLNDSSDQENGVNLSVRVGIATGPVVVGDLIGEGASQESSVVGETPNLAARLQGLAKPNQILIADSTQRLLGADFETQSLGSHRIKGFVNEVEVYDVGGAYPIASRFDSRVGFDLPPIQGRDQELALLLDRWNRARDGEGQGVMLVGEAGIGKSRISRALLDALHREPHMEVRYQCSPHHIDSALWPVIQQLQIAAGIDDSVNEDLALDAVEALLRGVDDSLLKLSPLIADLLNLNGKARYGPLELSPQIRRVRTLNALLDFLLGLAAQKPLVVVFEDVHWVDPTTQELINNSLERITSSLALILITSRAEQQPALAAHPNLTQLTLNRLGRSAIEAIVSRIKGDAVIPVDVLDTIVERTDGVPLFVEELTKTILEGGEAVIPTSLHDSLMARLDRNPETKAIAQVAACIGRDFDYALLSAIVELSDSVLNDMLDKLVAAGLLFCRGVAPEAEYTFKHALIRDAAYHSMLRGQRRQQHATIARVMEGDFPSLAEDRPELLAHHLEEGGLTLKAIHAWIAAAHRALPRAAFKEASAFVDRGLVAIDKQSDAPEQSAAAVDLRVLKYTAQYALGNPGQLLEILDEAERIASSLNDPVRLCKVLSAKTYVLSSEGQVESAIKIGQRNVALSNEKDDFNEFVMSKFMLGRSFYAAGRHRDAVQQVREAMDLLGEDVVLGHLEGGSLNQTLSARAWLVLFYSELGEFGLAEELGNEGMRLLQQIEGGTHERLWMRNAIGRLNIVKGDFDAAINALEPVLTIAEDNFPVYLPRVASSLGLAYATTGRPDDGVSLVQHAAAMARSMGFVFGQALVLSQLGEALQISGQAQEAQKVAKEALDIARRAGERGNEGWILLLLSKVSAQLNKMEDSQRYVSAGLRIADALGMEPLRQHLQRY